MTRAINSRKAAQLIEAAAAPRRCSRQNLEKLCGERGALYGSPCILQAKPLRIDADLVVEEYLAKVGQNQSEAQQPTSIRQVSSAPAAAPYRSSLELADSGDIPNFNEERALHEREKRRIAEMDRKVKAGQLAYIEDMEMAYNAVLLQLTTKAGSLHKQIKAAIPHLTHRELEKIERMISDIFESVASHDFKELPE